MIRIYSCVYLEQFQVSEATAMVSDMSQASNGSPKLFLSSFFCFLTRVFIFFPSILRRAIQSIESYYQSMILQG